MAHRLPCQPATAAAATATTRPEGNGPPPSISFHRGAWRPQWQLGKPKPNNPREYRGQRTRGPVLLLKA
ncbi:hypothetical protein B0T13DRAFT_491129 [Neurospora crassa]|nr:hypothetical protein B0T13DRAFT_492228 [Neurospora crassa]KAK3489775.1 hypothetical protein B0T13DRAFT_491129 [Neurospora crassa]